MSSAELRENRTLGPVRKRRWAQRGTSDCADEVTLSHKGAKSPTRARKLRSTGTKVEYAGCRTQIDSQRQRVARAGGRVDGNEVCHGVPPPVSAIPQWQLPTRRKITWSSEA